MSAGGGIGAAVGIALGVAGAPFTGGVSLWTLGAMGFAAGALAQQLIAPAGIPGNVNEGQRLQDLKIQSSSYGGAIPIIYGRMRTAGNIIWARPLIEEKTEQAAQSGGGGKTGGGVSSASVYYKYFATFAVGICRGTVDGVIKIFADSKLIYNIDTTDNATLQANTKIPFILYSGSETQLPDSTMQAFDGAANVPGYRGLAYVVFNRLPLADYGNRIPNLTFEIARSVSGAATPPPELKLILHLNTNLNDASPYGPRTPTLSPQTVIEYKTDKTGYLGGAAVKKSTGAWGAPAIITYPGSADFLVQTATPWQVISKLYFLQNSWQIIFNIGGGAVKLFVTSYNGGWPAFRVTVSGLSFGGAGYAEFIPTNNWSWSGLNEICLSWDGTVLRMLFNGILHGSSYTATGAVNWGGQTAPVFAIGGDTGDYSLGFFAYYDEFIFQNGGAVKTANYPPATTETGASAPPPVSTIKMLLNCDGQGGGTAIPDSSEYAHNGSGSNGAALDNAQKYDGAASIKIPDTIGNDVTTVPCVTIPGSADFNLANNIPWEISFAVKLGLWNTANDYILLSTGGSSYRPGGWNIRVSPQWNAGKWDYRLIFRHSTGTGLDVEFDIAGEFPSDWVKALINCDGGGAGRVYINGSLVAAAPIQAITNSARNLTIGAEMNTSAQTSAPSVNELTSPFWIDQIVFNNGGSVNTGATVGASTTTSAAPTSVQLAALQVKGEYLAPIISDLCQRAGLTTNDFDVSGISAPGSTGETRLIPGFIVNGGGSARQSIEMLMSAFMIECAESGLKLYFTSRHYKIIAGISGGVIPESDLAARRDKDGGELQPLEITTIQEVEVPAEVTVKYLDPARDYWPVSQRAIRQFSNSIQKAEINYPMALTPGQAAWAATVNLLAAWGERKRYKFSIPIKYAAIDVGDIKQINYGVQSHFVRITRMVYNNGILEMEAVGQDVTGIPANGTYSAAASVAGDPGAAQGDALPGTVPPAAPQTISYPATSTPILLDMNLIFDSHDGPGYYAAIDQGESGGYWPSGAIMKSADNNSYASLTGFAVSANIGVALTALPAGTTTIFDMGSTVTIKMKTGQLFSDSEGNVLNGANIGILDNEIIQWKTATLTAANTYVLSGLLRGRRGTESFTAAHAAGGRFVAYVPSSCQRAAGQLEEIGLARFYKAVTTGLDITQQPYYMFTNQARGLKPYSPAHIRGYRDSANNLTISWIRRTRKGGLWRDNVDAALGEAAELYEVDIMSGATALRTITDSVLISPPVGIVPPLVLPAAAYTADQQTADGLTPGNPVTVNIYQISAAAGRGYAGAATI